MRPPFSYQAEFLFHLNIKHILRAASEGINIISFTFIYYYLLIYLDKFWMNKGKLTRAGFEPADLRIDMPALYQLS